MASSLGTQPKDGMELEEYELLNSNLCNANGCFDEFIDKKLQKRVCVRFVPCKLSGNANKTGNTDVYCYCGRKEVYHSDAALQRGRNSPQARWHVETDTECQDTNVSGTYCAAGDRYPTRYVRVDYTTDMSRLHSFMQREWHMAPAQFVVTLIGSSTAEYLRKHVRTSVQHALIRLIEACNKLGGWLLVSGGGATQQVSTALSEHVHLERDALHLIALQPWGTLRHTVRQTLLSNSTTQDRSSGCAFVCKPTHEDKEGGEDEEQYDRKANSEGRLGRRDTAPNVLDILGERLGTQDTVDSPLGAQEVRRLDVKSKKLSVNTRALVDATESSQLHDLPSNHPFLLLVDSGQLGVASFNCEDDFRQRLEAEISVRRPRKAALERYVSSMVPSCYVLFAGGPQSMRQVQQALSRNVPVVVLRGTGKMADILALACSKADEEELDPAYVQLHGLPERLRVYLRQVTRERVEVPDEAMLSDVLTAVEQCLAYHQLIHVFAVDAAKCDLDTAVLRAMLTVHDRPSSVTLDLNELLSNALLYNHVDCVRLIIDKSGMSLCDFLTVERLATLFTPENIKASTFKSLLFDHRARDARWASRNSNANAGRPQDTSDSEFDSARTPCVHNASDATQRPRSPDKDFRTVQHGFYCPLTLAGRVITWLLGTYFHSSFLHSGHHVKHQPEAVIAAGPFKPSQTADTPARVDLGDAEELLVAVDSHLYTAQPSANHVDSKKFDNEELVPHRSSLDAGQPEMPGFHHNALTCTGDHTRVMRIKVSRRRLAEYNGDALRHRAGTFAGDADGVGLLGDDKHGHAKLQQTDAEEVVRRVIAEEFRFVHSEQCAALHLFVWCTLQVRSELGMLFWRRTRHTMAAACLARLLLRGLQKAEQSVEMKTRIITEVNRLEQLALGVLNTAYELDARHTVYLLVASVPDAAELSTIQLAAQADCKNFIAHQVCSALLDDVWCGRLSPRNGWARVLLCLVIPVLVPFLISFRTRRSIHKALRREVTHSHSLNASPTTGISRHDRFSPARDGLPYVRECSTPDFGDMHFTYYQHAKQMKATSATSNARQRKQCCESCADCCSKVGSLFRSILVFYTAPKTIFLMNTLFYIIFLILFSYTMLFSFITSIDKFVFTEWVVIICMLSLALEEARQLLTSESGSLRTRLNVYFSSAWNRFDFGCLLAFHVGCGLAAVPPLWCNMCLESGRILIIISLMILYFRLLNIFSVNQVLGPKLVMLGKMIKSVVVIFIMIGVFIAAYGVAAQSILYPNVGQHDLASVIRNVTMRGYFAMFGDLRLEEIENAAPCDSLYQEAYAAEGLSFGDYSLASDSLTNGTSEQNQKYCTNELSKYVMPVLLAIHVVVTNLVLFNVLIAMFNFIFNQIDDQTDEHWRFNMYHLIEEYRAKPPLIPPFILIWHFLLLVYWLITAFPCCRSLRHTSSFRSFRRLLTTPPFCCERVPRDISDELSRFERAIANRYLAELEKVKQTENDARLTQIDNAVKDMNTLLTAVHDVVIATDYNTELIKRERSPSAGDVFESMCLHGRLQELVQEVLQARMQPIEQKLNVVLDMLTQLKSAKP